MPRERFSYRAVISRLQVKLIDVEGMRLRSARNLCVLTVWLLWAKP
jgi:hypothetical protein